ncbi:hypothetical protein [Hymenobacter wooponensis]|uniref:Uncharacterized protein n=1 Tax=Hymenobacter wooponensis TaxID=1525360 RepID=A0A4Z0MKQ6_9BACT|nr:hypothetical protein [Hymenobacter wooponensis]TGD79765.1 hypothetical protein EU557_16265 [Hymenobacter wooponensis]
MSEIAINLSLQEAQYEIDLSGTAAQFASLVNRVNHLTKYSPDVLSLRYKPSAYPTAMRQLWLEQVDQSNGLITVQVNDIILKLLGNSQAFYKLTVFLESLSNLRPGEHFHLDWFSNEDLLAPTTASMSFIFSMEID